MLCAKCQQKEATFHVAHITAGHGGFNLHLCESCSRPVVARLEASQQGRQDCGICGGDAFTPLPLATDIIYACCNCRLDFTQAFFDICAAQRPELTERSQGNVHFFETSFDPEVEKWRNAASREAIAKLRSLRL